MPQKKLLDLKFLPTTFMMKFNLVSWFIQPASCVFVAGMTYIGVECEIIGLSTAKIDEMGLTKEIRTWRLDPPCVWQNEIFFPPSIVRLFFVWHSLDSLNWFLFDKILFLKLGTCSILASSCFYPVPKYMEYVPFYP